RLFPDPPLPPRRRPPPLPLCRLHLYRPHRARQDGGPMKFRTFRILVTLGVIAAVVALVFVIRRPAEAPTQPPVPTKAATAPPPTAPPPTAPPPTAPPAATAPPPSASTGNLRPMDQEILDRVKSGIPGDKLTDAIPGHPWKVNLYKDAGQTAINRAKIDLNRNDKWDEKWSFEGGVVKRQVAPADDESYTERYMLKDGSWQKEGPTSS